VNLESLRQRKPKITTVVLEDGSEWRVRKVSAATAIALSKVFLATGNTDPDSPEAPIEQRLEAFSLFISKALCDEAGNLTLDTDEGRAELMNLDIDTLTELVFKLSTPTESKKN
jgi:hypothetical protein